MGVAAPWPWGDIGMFIGVSFMQTAQCAADEREMPKAKPPKNCPEIAPETIISGDYRSLDFASLYLRRIRFSTVLAVGGSRRG